MPRIDPEIVALTNTTGYPPPHDKAVAHRWVRRLGPALGLTDFGVSHVVLKPGGASSQRHWHEDEDEFVVMLAGEAVLVERTPADGGAGRLSLVPVDGDRPARDVAALDGGVGPLSVATDLVTEQRPTVSRPAPDWPWSEERWVLTVGLGGLGLLVAGGLAWLVRRRAQRRSAR